MTRSGGVFLRHIPIGKTRRFGVSVCVLNVICFVTEAVDSHEQPLMESKLSFKLQISGGVSSAVLELLSTRFNRSALSGGALLVSPHCYSDDEREFTGLVDFLDVREMTMYATNFASMEILERQRLSDQRKQRYTIAN